MKEETKGTLYTCDACGEQTFRLDVDTPPVGLHGNILVVNAGGDVFEFYSCERDDDHIAQALKNAFKRFREDFSR